MSEEKELVGLELKFTDGFVSYRPGSVMTTATKNKIKSDACGLYDIKIVSKELIGDEKDVKSFNDYVTEEFKKRLVRFKFTGFSKVAINKLFEQLMKQLVIEAQKMRSQYTDEEICAFVEAGEFEIELEKLLVKAVGGGTKTAQKNGDDFLKKATPEEAKALYERMKADGLLTE